MGRYRFYTVKNCAMAIAIALCLVANSALGETPKDAKQIVREAIDYWRGATSHTIAEMLVHRSSWERSMSMEAWTEGEEKTLVRFTAPAKDAGSASLTIDNEVWSYSPKINRIVKIPSSMRSQSWMGSDFSYQDLSKANDILEDYEHELVSTAELEGHTVFTISAIPKPSAAVVWGKEVLLIRDDNIILVHEFYDQDIKLVKKLTAREIKPLGGRIYATVIRMEKTESLNEWTEVTHREASFGIAIPDSVFTLSNLSNPRAELR